MASFMRGIEVVKLAAEHGWRDRGPGGDHPYVLVKPGHRSVAVRQKLNNRFEAQKLMKELGIPKENWPEKLR
jgi:hypothetical protein